MRDNSMQLRILVLDDNLLSVQTAIHRAISNYLSGDDSIPAFAQIDGESSPVCVTGLSQVPIQLTFECNIVDGNVVDAARSVCQMIANNQFTGPYDIVLLDDNWPDGDAAGRDLLLEPVAKHIRGISSELPIISLFTIDLNATRLKALYEVIPSKINDDWVRVWPCDKNYDLTFIDLLQRTIAIKRVAEDRARLANENRRLRQQVGSIPENIIGSNPAMLRVYGLINSVAPTNATVLIKGESGTGKELVASAIHSNSPRSNSSFVKVNCAALPESVIESELFGHEKGAFTGAVQQRKGRFELADKGTIFLDEIGDLPPSTQVKLLRVLQEREFERVGGTETVKVDVRIIAATHRDLKKLIREEKFREDLYYRLCVIPIQMPSLREHRDDIPALVNHFVKVKSQELNKSAPKVSNDAMKKLESHLWPGNVRELTNIIERAVLLCGSSSVLPEHVHIEQLGGAIAEDNTSLVPMNINIDKDKAGKALIYLEECEEVARGGSDVTHDQLATRWGCAKSNVTQRIGFVKNEMKAILNHPPNSGRWAKARASGCFKNWSILS